MQDSSTTPPQQEPSSSSSPCITSTNTSTTGVLASSSTSDAAIRKRLSKMDFSYRGTQIIKGMSPDQLWPFACDSDSWNRAIGSTSAIVTYDDDDDNTEGGADRTSTTSRYRRNIAWNLPGGVTLTFYEHPFEWDAESHWWTVVRLPHEGPIRTSSFFLKIHPINSNNNDSEVEMISAFEARNGDTDAAMQAVEAVDLLMHKMLEVPFQMLSEGKPWKLATTPVLDQSKMEVCARSLCDLGESKSVVDSLVAHLAHRQESDLVDMQPKRLAAKWKQDERETISCFLRGARIGLLEPKWSLMCP
jgi:hypothetical protein